MRALSSLFKKIFFAPTDNTWVQLFRYGFVGGTAFVVDFVALYLFTEVCHIYYLVSASLSFVLGLVVNYLLSTVWIFRDGKMKNRWMEFIVFALIGVVGLGLNALVMWFFTDLLSVYYMASKAISTAIVFLWNFFARKLILFHR